MIKVYVSDVPKNCENCPFYKLDTYVDVFGSVINSHECVLEGSILTGTCPLKPLSEALTEERKRIVKEIRDSAGNYFELPYCDECGNTNGNDVVLTGNDLTEILDGIENE